MKDFHTRTRWVAFHSSPRLFFLMGLVLGLVFAHPSLAQTPSTSQSETESPLDRAERSANEKKWDEVIQTLKPLNDSLPRKSLLTLATAFEHKKEYLSQIRTLQLCVAKHPGDYVAITELGRAYSLAGRKNDAQDRFLEAKSINSKYRPAYEGLLVELEKNGPIYEAIELVNDMQKVFGAHSVFFSTLCRLYTLDGHIKKAIETCESAITRDGKNPENYINLSKALKNGENTDKANQVLTKALGRFPASELVQATAGEMQIERKDFVAAYRIFKKASETSPNSGRAQIGYADAAFALQKNEEALKAYIRACKLDKKLTKNFRTSYGVLRERKDFTWQQRFESGLNQCH
jgi:tetratricopeptide (TPR) repeat protein